MTCPDCNYLFEERVAIHIHDGKATEREAKRLAIGVRCPECEEKGEKP